MKNTTAQFAQTVLASMQMELLLLQRAPKIKLMTHDTKMTRQGQSVDGRPSGPIVHVNQTVRQLIYMSCSRKK